MRSPSKHPAARFRPTSSPCERKSWATAWRGASSRRASCPTASRSASGLAQMFAPRSTPSSPSRAAAAALPATTCARTRATSARGSRFTAPWARPRLWAVWSRRRLRWRDSAGPPAGGGPSAGGAASAVAVLICCATPLLPLLLGALGLAVLLPWLGPWLDGAALALLVVSCGPLGWALHRRARARAAPAGVTTGR